MYRYTITTPATGEVVTLQEVKSFLRVTSTYEDALIQSLISGAVATLESYTRRTFMATGFRGEYDRILTSGLEAYPFVKIKRSPLVEVASVQAITGGVWVDVGYQVKAQPTFSRVLFPDGTPATDDTPFPLRIDFTSGYSGCDDTAMAKIKTAVLQYVSYLHASRGDCTPECGMGIPVGVRALLESIKIIDSFAV